MTQPSEKSTARYFVDEAGDPTLFSSKGKVLVGSEGCSHYFLLGKLHVGDPEALTKEMDELRTSLLADPYFKGIASMQPAARKTALKFHAKDDVPEVRREVYELLLAQAEKIRFYGVVRDKRELASHEAQKRDADPKYRYRPNDLYDGLVRMLFGSRFHQADRFEICFASRGSSDRTKALKTAIAHAAGDYERDFGSASKAEVDVTSRTPTGCGGCRRWTICFGRCSGSTRLSRRQRLSLNAATLNWSGRW